MTVDLEVLSTKVKIPVEQQLIYILFLYMLIPFLAKYFVTILRATEQPLGKSENQYLTPGKYTSQLVQETCTETPQQSQLSSVCSRMQSRKFYRQWRCEGGVQYDESLQCICNLLKCHMYNRMLMPIHQPTSHNTMPKASRECRESD